MGPFSSAILVYRSVTSFVLKLYLSFQQTQGIWFLVISLLSPPVTGEHLAVSNPQIPGTTDRHNIPMFRFSRGFSLGETVCFCRDRRCKDWLSCFKSKALLLATLRGSSEFEGDFWKDKWKLMTICNSPCEYHDYFSLPDVHNPPNV